MQHSKGRESIIAVILLAGLAMAVDLAAFAIAIKSHQLIVAVCIHLALGVVLSGLVYYRISRNKDYRFTVLLLITVLAAGPFGSTICLLAVIGYMYCSLSASSPDEWISSIFSYAEEENKLYEQISFDMDNIRKVSGVEPFQNILSSGTMLQKQAVIAKMTRYFRPEFSPLMIEATQDANAAIRVQAAASLSKIERQFTLRYVQLEKQLKDTPPYKAEWLELAEIYEEYASAGLIDEYSICAFREKAAKIYQEYLSVTHDLEIQARLARIYLRQNRPEVANKLLGDLINAGENISPAALLCYIESFFNLHKFDDVRRVVNHYVAELATLDKHKYMANIDEALHLWEQEFSNDNRKNEQYTSEKVYAA